MKLPAFPPGVHWAVAGSCYGKKIQDQHGNKYLISDKNAAAYLRVTDLSPVGG